MCTPKRPFTLEYLAYAKTVWELGQYEEVPEHLKREPLPYPEETGHEPLMYKCYQLRMHPLPWVKEVVCENNKTYSNL